MSSRTRDDPLRQVAAQRLPGLAVVLGDEEVGLIVVGAVRVEGDIAAPGHVARGLDRRHPARPGSPAALNLSDRSVQFLPPSRVSQTAPVVSAHPEDVGVLGRLGQAVALPRPVP